MSDQPWQVVETTVYQLDGKPLRGAPDGVNAWWAHVQGPNKDLCLKVAARMGAVPALEASHARLLAACRLLEKYASENCCDDTTTWEAMSSAVRNAIALAPSQATKEAS